MNVLFYILLYLYGTIMGVSSFLLFKDATLPLWIMGINLIGSITLFLTPISKYFFYTGIVLIIMAAIINGFWLNGFPNPKHLLIRFIFSLIMILLYRYIEIKS